MSTLRERKIAIKVLAESKMVQNWIKGELDFLEFDKDSLEGRRIIAEKAEEIARRLIR